MASSEYPDNKSSLEQMSLGKLFANETQAILSESLSFSSAFKLSNEADSVFEAVSSCLYT